MGMLGRYKKAGGFVQLLKLIETCEEKKKRDNFLNMVEREDIHWARAIKMKMLTVDRVLTWEQDVLQKIAYSIPEDVIAALMHKYEVPLSERLLPAYTNIQRERIQDIVKMGAPTERELMRAVASFVTQVRTILQEGRLPTEKIDATLPIPSNIEELLARGQYDLINGGQKGVDTAPKAPGIAKLIQKPRSGISNVSKSGKKAVRPKEEESGEEVVQLQAEVTQLKEKLSTFAYQNNRLRREMQNLKEQLEKERDLKKSS